MSYDLTPEAGEPSSEPVTETANVRLVPRRGSGLTLLVGGSVSINQVVEAVPKPG